MAEMTSEELQAQQIEALQVVNGYIKKLIPSMETIITELNGEKQEDTDDFLEHIINGLNWVIEVFNGTMSLINQDKVVIDKDQVNQEVLQLSDALIAKNDARAATVLDSGILPFLREFETISGMYL